MQNFWTTLRRPIFALAPMEDVTDAAFRRLIAGYGKPSVFFTEFTSADGLVLAPEKGQTALKKKLIFDGSEKPIVAQLFSANPERMEKAARMVRELGFDGVDINMGCPDKSVEKQGAGASLIKNPELARELIRSAKESAKGKMPVSVKTRMGYNKDEVESWIPEILAEKPDSLIVHLRTRKEMSKVDAHWDRMKDIVEIRNKIAPEVLILGNGDVKSIEEAREKIRETGCDGVMLGRAIFGNPFLFSDKIPTPEDKIKALREHIQLFEHNLGGVKSFAVMKKHFKSYLSGIDSGLKDDMLRSGTSEEAVAILDRFLNK
jgi:nifR3 family TIM-barrel protein